MDELGLRPYNPTVKKGAIANWLDKMAKINEESFNGKRLDCSHFNNDLCLWNLPGEQNRL